MDSLLNFGMSKVDGAAEAAGFSPWGQSAAYSVKNAATGMYLAAHKDGELVAEDNDLQHHDLVWRIFEHPNGSVALQSCHGTWLQAHGNSPNSTATEPAAAAHWKLGRSGHGGHTLQSHNHQFLSAVPPVEGEQNHGCKSMQPSDLVLVIVPPSLYQCAPSSFPSDIPSTVLVQQICTTPTASG
ncbi:hypothetical protein JKP88DRAFT_262723 [Tribonema minus]|uniref:Fascin-like domain-containing protein n=1 Tax=Tribonema minus TaxID=303371 RepID=A0A835Z4H9_9STRA|nr:hypothetical protein JKP88DRAFT_262723 [Tribonema minus]